MKKYHTKNILIGFMLLISCRTLGQQSVLAARTSSIINSLDTVYFNLSAAVTAGSTIEFPVYMHSDDQIVALDFSFKYDHTRLVYDTIIKLASYIDALSNYNTIDSTVRLTSYSFTNSYPNDSALFTIRFTVLSSGLLCSGELNSESVLLNGDVCSFGMLDCASGIYPPELESDCFRIYPNPISSEQFLNIEGLPKGSEWYVSDSRGRILSGKQFVKKENEIVSAPVKLSSGVYWVTAVISGRRYMRLLVAE